MVARRAVRHRRLSAEMGAVVACCLGGSDWRVGVVVQRWHRLPDYPPGTCAAYAVTLDETVGGTAKVDDALDASGKLRDGQMVIMVPRDEPACCVRATGRIGGRLSVLEALGDMHITGRQSMLHVVMAHLDLPTLLALHTASQCTLKHARRVLNSWAWLQSPDGRAAVRRSALGLSCASNRQSNGIPKSWWAVPPGSKPRDTLCWGWRTNLEQAVKRGDAAMVRMIARTPPDVATMLFRHAAEVHLFAETQMLLQRACLRAHVGAAEALFDVCFVRVDAASLKQGPTAWRRLAQSRGWAGETEMLGCCYKVGSPVLQLDDVAPEDAASQADLDATAEMLLRHGASPTALGGTKNVSPLFMAALNANARLVGAFLAAGADPDAPIGDGTGNTPRIACRSCFEESGNDEYAPVVAMLDNAARALEDARRRALPTEAWATLDAICEDAYAEGVLPPAMPAQHIIGVRIADPEQRRRLRRCAVDKLTEKRMHTLTSNGDRDIDHDAESYKQLVRMIERTLRSFPAVRITGLTGKPELNGQIGELAGECTGDASRGDVRYPVRMRSGNSWRMVKVKAQNLRGCAAGTSSIEAQD